MRKQHLPISRQEKASLFIGEYLVRANGIELYLDSCIGLWVDYRLGGKRSPSSTKMVASIAPAISYGRKPKILKQILSDFRLSSDYPTLVKDLEHIIKLRDKLAHGSDLVRDKDLAALVRGQVVIHTRSEGNIHTLFLDVPVEIKRVSNALFAVTELRDRISAGLKNK